MYPVSDEFHAAVQNGNRQKAMLIFSDAVFTDVDINIDKGIEFHDFFNVDENLKIGQTPSNEISFGLFNDLRYLNDYEFGDFLATIGVLVVTDNYVHSGNAMVRTQQATYVGQGAAPFLLRNGIAVSSQPTFPVASLMAYDGKVWAFSDSAEYKVYNDATGEDITAQNPVNVFMRNKVKDWVGYGYFYNKTSRRLMIYRDGERNTYEFCPLGWFIAERPNAPDVIEISMTCYDFMQKFDDDMPSDADLGVSYPITIKNLLRKLCDYVGLPLKTTSFINDGLTVSSRPEDFDNCTMRTVLGWIAEAAASNARIDRDGNVILDWVRQTDQAFDETGYVNFEPYWYQTRKVTKLYNRDTNEGTQSLVGSGKEGYLIQDNPFLRGLK